MDYTSYKQIYTHGDLYTLSGKPYTGFIQYKDGVVLASGSSSDTLVPNNSYGTSLFASGIFKDRVIKDEGIQLPSSNSECTFGLNETLNYETFKYKLENIRRNITYMYSRMFIASNNLPAANKITYAGLTKIYDQELTTTTLDRNFPSVDNAISFYDSDEFQELANIFDVTTQINYEDSTKFTMFCASSSLFIAITGNNDNLSIVETSSAYETLSSNTQNFGEIGGIASNKDSLFISDKQHNIILKYDIKGFVNNDVALSNKRYLQEVLGGKGSIDRRANLSRPGAIACNGSDIVVYDSGNYCLKVFTVDFDYKTTFSIFRYRPNRRDQEIFRAMAFDPDFGTLYILNSLQNNRLRLYRLNIETQKFDTTEISDILADDEVVNTISFSKVDSNFWYYSTNKQIYKKFKTRPEETIGSFNEGSLINRASITNNEFENRWNYQNVQWLGAGFLWNKEGTSTNVNGSTANAIQSQNFKGFNILLGSDGFDKQIIFTKSRVYFFDEPTTTAYTRVLTKPNYQNYSTGNFSLNPKEYIQVATINAELYKLLQDLFILRDNIVGRFSGRYVNGDIILDSYNYNIDFDDLRAENIEDYFLHHNEENTVGGLNRILNKAYNLQTKLINISNTDTQDEVNLSLAVLPDPPLTEALKITKTTDKPGPYKVGSNITYTVTLSNNTEDPINDITLTDTLCSSLFDIEDPLDVFNTGITLSPRTSTSIYYKYTVTNNDALQTRVSNIATASSPRRGTVAAESTVGALFLEKTLKVKKKTTTQGPYYVGFPISYQVDITNNGDVAAENILLFDNLTSDNNIDVKTYNTDDLIIESDPLKLIQGQGVLQPGESTTVKYKFKPERRGNLTNFATVTSFDDKSFASNEVEITPINCIDGMDVVFSIDYTGSMRNIINSVKNGVKNLTDTLSTLSNDNYRLALNTSDEITTGNASKIYNSNSDWANLPADQKYFQYTGYKRRSRNGYFLLTTWSPLSEDDDAFVYRLNRLASEVRLGYGISSIPGDVSLQKIIDDNFAGVLRPNVARYIIFITDTYLGTAGVFRSDNRARVDQVIASAVNKGIKIFVIGPGVNRDGIWREIAESTGGSVNSSGDATSIINEITQSCQ